LTELHGALSGPSGGATQSDVNVSGPDPSGRRSCSVRPVGGDEMGTLGSRMSLRSLSCASSSGAESYNSYRLLVNQAGASWRELWRTRMLLMDVLRWAEAVAPLAHGNGSTPHDVHTSEPSAVYPSSPAPTVTAPLPPILPTDPVDWNTRFASLLAAALMPRGQDSTTFSPPAQTLVPTPSTVSQPLQHPNPLSSLKMGETLGSMDPMMAAAFAAATAAAATVAIQQQQQQQQQCHPIQPPSMSPLSGSESSPAQTQASRSHLILSPLASSPPMAASVAPGSLNEVFIILSHSRLLPVRSPQVNSLKFESQPSNRLG
uniref:Pecanex-like protein n=1 Tax=Echinostoma caproni TaxID=27848 RepID=A0A183A0T6_9TREM